MPRYMVERHFPQGLTVPANADGAGACCDIAERNAEGDVAWIQSYVSSDKKTTFCIYDAPTPEAIRMAAQKNNLPVTRITQIRVLDPYFYY